jgi:hypothetical protein
MFLGVIHRFGLNQRAPYRFEDARKKISTDFAFRVFELFQQADPLDPSERLHLYVWHYRLLHIRLLNKDLLPGLIKDAAKRKLIEQRQFKAKVSRSVKIWATKAVSGHAKDGHAYLKKPDTLPRDHIVENEVAIVDPSKIMQVKACFWADLWTAIGTHERSKAGAEISRPIRALATKLQELRSIGVELRAKEDDIQYGQMAKAIKRLRDDRGLGLDWWAPRELKNLSVESIKKLTNIMNRSERVMAPPLQSLLSLIALIPKPIKGDRPVVLASMWLCVVECLKIPRGRSLGS